MEIVNLPLIPLLVFNLFLGFFVLLNNRKSVINQSFFAFIVFITIWIFCNFLIDNLKDHSSLLLWTKLSYASGIFIPLFYFYFSLGFGGSLKTLSNPAYFFRTSSIPLSMVLLSFTNLIVSDVRITERGVELITGIGLVPYFLVFVGYLMLSSYNLFLTYKTGNNLKKLQLKYFIFGTIATAVLVAVVNFLVPFLLDNWVLSTYTPYFTLIMLLSISYAIVAHQLLDIRLVVARAVAYSLLIFSLAIFYIGSAVILTNFLFETSTTTGQLLLYSALSLVVAFTFQPLRKFFEHITDKIFFEEDYDQTALLSDLTKTMAKTILIDDIAHNLLKKILYQMRITRGAFVLTDGGKIFVVESSGYKQEPKFSEKDIFSLQALDKNLVFEDLEEGETKDLLRRLNVTVVIPLKTQLDHVGVLLLGEKASGEIYSSKDIKVLEIFAPEAAISFENAKSVEKIRRFNITLREQVEKATYELRSANEQLKELDRLKDEFLSIASHDLRTPMAAIKSYLWMALNGRAGEIKNDKLKRYLEISYTSSERMIALINDLLNVSRIEAGRVQLSFEEASLRPMVNQVLTEIASEASEKSIDLTYEEEPKLPSVILDKQRFTEILQNLIGNALKFTPDNGKVTVKAVRSAEEGFIEISVTDTGVGIEKEDMAKLFTKYGRLQKSYTASSTSGGTGLGLYITKNYVELHGGKIWVTSEPGKGSTFTFTLKQANKNILAKMRAESEKKTVTNAVPQIK